MTGELLLFAAAGLAAFFQSVTGIGFGMIAGPVVLLVLAEPAAVVISTLMSWLIALVLMPVVWRSIDWQRLGRYLAGAALGLPLGLAVLAVSDVGALKLLAGTVIGLLTLMMVFGAPGIGAPGRPRDLVFSGLAGIFGGCLAMPGPTVALRMAATGAAKAVVRGTMVAFFALIWPLVLAGQVLVVGLGATTLANAAKLVPAVLLGTLAGQIAAGRVSERAFRRMVLVFLAITAVGLIGEAAWRALGGWG